jgi:methionine-rich copper-binding protein CopC
MAVSFLRTSIFNPPSSASCLFVAVKGLSQSARRLWILRVYRLIVLAIFCSLPALASAHAYLVKSVPAGRATLFSSPGKIQLWFNERLEPKYSTLTVYDSAGKRVDADQAQVLADDPKQLSLALKALPAGRYTVKFRVLSVDGHVVEQSFPFTVRETKN